MSDRLTTLLDALPLCQAAPPLDPSSAPPGVGYRREPRKDFVPPSLRLDPDELAAAQLVVVSAPAAVGKSMLADYLALRTGGVVWDLAESKVGNNFAIGMLAAAHGPDRLGDVLRQLQCGDFLVIADALDEARLRVTFDAFTAFLDDLARQIVKAVPTGRPSVVLLARGETADFAREWFDDELRISTALVEIEFFDRAQALEFVDKQLSVQGVNPSLEAVQQARDLIFERTLELLDSGQDDWAPETVGRFLGYAPVLVATARFLASDTNPKRLVEDLLADRRPGLIWEFLHDLVSDILRREQGKFLHGFRTKAQEKLGLGEQVEWDRVFTPPEQCAWIVSEATGTDAPTLPVPPPIQPDYRSEVRGWLAQHPFVGATVRDFASPVFEDYAYAQILADGAEATRVELRARTATGAYRPKEMLARFLGRLASQGITAPDVPVVCESLATATESGRPVLFFIEEDAVESGELLLTIGYGADTTEIPVVAAGEPVQIFSRLSYAGIWVRTSTVQLGVGGRLFEVGPAVTVFGPAVEVLAESIFVDSRMPGDGPSVMILTPSLVAKDPVLKFVHGGDAFRVTTAGTLRYPFADKAAQGWPFALTQRFNERHTQVAAMLFRIAQAFRVEGYSRSLGSYAEPLDRLAARNPIAREIFEVGDQIGLLTREGSFYRFHPEVLGLDYRAVRSHQLSEQAGQFVIDVEKRLPTVDAGGGP